MGLRGAGTPSLQKVLACGLLPGRWHTRVSSLCGGRRGEPPPSPGLQVAADVCHPRRPHPPSSVATFRGQIPCLEVRRAVGESHQPWGAQARCRGGQGLLGQTCPTPQAWLSRDAGSLGTVAVRGEVGGGRVSLEAYLPTCPGGVAGACRWDLLAVGPLEAAENVRDWEGHRQPFAQPPPVCGHTAFIWRSLCGPVSVPCCHGNSGMAAPF